MERAVALKKICKLLGKKTRYRIDTKAASREERDAARAKLSNAVKARNELQEKRNDRQRAILAADAEYQSLLAAHKAAVENSDKLLSIMRHHKITVGTDEGFFFSVKAEGDSWEEIIEKLTAKQHA